MSIFDRLFKRTPPLGYLRDPVDSRDLQLAALGLPNKLPARADVSHPLVKVRDQGATMACVGYAVSTAVRLALLADGKISTPVLSARFPYYNARRRYTKMPQDVGTFIRDAMRSVMKMGVASEATCPLLPVNQQPTWEAYTDAHVGRGMRGYYRVNMTPDEVKRALAAGKPVVAGWTLDHAFGDPRGPKVVDKLTDDVWGGHAMVIVGYEWDEFILHNSWGPGWRQGGTVRVGEQFIAQGHDGWAIDT